MTLKAKFLTIILIIISISAFSQEGKFFRIENNVPQNFFDEYNISFNYRNSDFLGSYISLGYKYNNQGLRNGFKDLSPSQWDYPILAYNGPVFRMGYIISDYSITKNNNPSIFYIKFGYIFKYLYYKNKTFYDSVGDGYFYYFHRSEKAWVNGADLIFGKSTNIFSKFYIDYHFGIGFRYKIRNFIVDASGLNCLVSDGAYVGTYNYGMHYFTAILGISIGMNLIDFSKKEKTDL